MFLLKYLQQNLIQQIKQQNLKHTLPTYYDLEVLHF